MGFNSVVVVLTDALHYIAEDHNFGKNLSDAINELAGRGRRVDVRSGGHANAASVISHDHADVTHLILAGGNYGAVLGRCHNGGRFLERQHQFEVFKETLDKLGYRVSRKRTNDPVVEIASIPIKTKADRVAELEELLKTAYDEIAKLSVELDQARSGQS